MKLKKKVGTKKSKNNGKKILNYRKSKIKNKN